MLSWRLTEFRKIGRLGPLQGKVGATQLKELKPNRLRDRKIIPLGKSHPATHKVAHQTPPGVVVIGRTPRELKFQPRLVCGRWVTPAC